MTNPETSEQQTILPMTRVGLAAGVVIGLTLGAAYGPGGAVGLAIFLGFLGNRFEWWFISQ